MGDHSHGVLRQLDSDFRQQLTEKSLSLVTGSHTQPRRQAFFELFSTILPAIEEATKRRLLQIFFGLCKHQDSNVRNLAATILGSVRKAVDEQDFKLGLNALVREICRMTPAEVAGYRPLFDGSLEHSALFGDYEWRDLADLSKRSLQQTDTALQDYGLLLVERMPKIPSEHDADLIHLLVSVARGTNSSQKERADKMLRKISEPDLSPSARRSLKEYLAPPEEKGNSQS